MEVVIQCAASKNPDAGLFASKDVRPVHFVARLELCVPDLSGKRYARPNAQADLQGKYLDGKVGGLQVGTGRFEPVAPQPRMQHYSHKMYTALAERFGVSRLQSRWRLSLVLLEL